jgi:tetratricopeptide (TPR) repeat protein
MSGVSETIELAAQHHQAGALEQAEQLYHQVLQSEPDNAAALHLLGVIAHQRADDRLAADLINKAIANNSRTAQFHNNLGVVLKALGRLEEAVHAYQKALQLKPDYADARYNMGNSLGLLGRHGDALECYNQALPLKPDDPYIYYNIAVAMQYLGRHSEAVENFSRAIGLNHNDSAVYCAMAVSQQILGRHADAIETLRAALRLNPDCARTHTDLGMVLLMTGNFAEGWQQYHWRLEHCCWVGKLPDRLRWKGSNFKNRSILVCSEQGLGDCLQFVRYIPMVKARGGTVVLGVYEQLYSLLKQFPGADETIKLTAEKALPSYDLYVPLMELPKIFATRLETIPAEVPYIFADPVKSLYWRNRLSGPGFKVGVVWAGSAEHMGKHLRDCKFADFAALAEVEGVRLYALQKGKDAEQINRTERKIPVVSLGEQFTDFSDTAAAIENLDLVISVDTSVLHLAGAMGKPVWGILCVAGEWRWLLDRPDSPWYPTMRLFRQKKLDCWAGVFRDVAEQLRIVVREKAAKVKNSKSAREFIGPDVEYFTD